MTQKSEGDGKDEGKVEADNKGNNDGYGGEEINAGEVVVVEAEGKQDAFLVGVLRMGTAEIKEVGKGVVMDGGHYLGDGLWGLKVE